MRGEEESARAVVFPAYAGMSRVVVPSTAGITCFPRLRGDEPSGPLIATRVLWFSPPTRG